MYTVENNRTILLAFSLLAFAACSGHANPSLDGGADTDSDADADSDAGALSGSLIWAQHLGGSDFIASSDAWILGNQGRSVTALSDGTFCAAGSFVSEAVFGGGTENPVAHQSTGGAWDGDAFVGRWKADGAPEWVISVGGDSGESIDGFAELETLPGDSVIAIARLEDGADLDPLGDVPIDAGNDAVPMYNADGWLVRYTEWIDGGEIWTHGASYNQDLRLHSALDGEFVVSIGRYGGNDPVVLGAGEPNETTLTPDPETLLWSIIAKYTPDGSLDWAVKLENGSHEIDLNIDEIAIGPNGEVVAAGFYGHGDAIVFGADGSETVLPWLDIGTDTTGHFLAKWSNVGDVEWVKQVPAVYAPSPLFIRDDGAIIWMDSFKNSWVFDPGGPAEVTIAEEACTEEWCFLVMEIAPDGSSFTPHLMDGGGSYIGMRSDGSFALAGGNVVGGYNADYEREWEATIESAGTTGGAWIHDVAALADGSVVVIGDYTDSIILGEGEPNETVLHGVCDECIYGAFLARYAW